MLQHMTLYKKVNETEKKKTTEKQKKIAFLWDIPVVEVALPASGDALAAFEA